MAAGGGEPAGCGTVAAFDRECPMPKPESWRRRWARRSARLPRRPAPLPWGSILLVLLLLVAVPTAADVALARAHPGLVAGLQAAVAGVYALTSAMLLWEAWSAWRVRDRPPPGLPPLPACTAIVAAYLPNEQDIILETVTHLLTRVDVPPGLFQVILAYNTPESLAVEADLQEIAARDPRLLPLRVSGSRSKAENVNAALGAATGDVVAVFDADHLPAPDCFRRAWRWLGSGSDMVQGRCLIRNHAHNWLTRTVAVEFDTIYAVSHPGRAALSGTAIFGGSNGYWRRGTLTRLGMNPAMLTEDIDVSVRALLSGCRLAARDWVTQRKRWAQGWLEVALRYTLPVLRSPHFRPGQKVLWFYLLAWREVYPAVSIQFFSLVLTSWIVHIPIHWFGSPFFVATAALNLACGPLVLLATYLCAPPRARRGLGAWYWAYGLLALVYTTLKLSVTLVAQVSHLLQDRAWVTTPRTRPIGAEASTVQAETASVLGEQPTPP